MIKVGVIGVGFMGFNHARIFNEFSKEGLVELVGVADIDYAKALRTAKTFNTKAYSSHRELIGKVDAVSIATPTKVHKDIALDFINAGVHVLIEKPIADTVENALEIIRAIKKTEVVVAIGHVERFNPVVEKLREIIDKGSLGDIVVTTAKRTTPRVSDISIVLDLAIHDIDVMRYITRSEVVKVYAQGRRIRSDSTSEDYGLIMLMFRGGIDGFIEVSRLVPYRVRELVVVGTKGTAHLNYVDQRLTIYSGNEIKDIEVAKEEPLKLELLDFIEAIIKNRKPKATAYDGLYALKIAEEAIKSTREGRPIEIIYDLDQGL